MTMNRLTLEEQAAQLFTAWHSIDKLYGEYARSVGLTYLGLSVLNAIYEAPENCTQKDICERTNLPKQSVNVAIRAMWEQGYVEMKELSSDRRNKAIRLTVSGRAYADAIIGRLMRAETRIMGRLTYEQRQSVLDLMQQVQADLRDSLLAKDKSREDR